MAVIDAKHDDVRIYWRTPANSYQEVERLQERSRDFVELVDAATVRMQELHAANPSRDYLIVGGTIWGATTQADRDRLLNPEQVRRLAAMQVIDEQGAAVTAFLADQKAAYEQAEKGQLVEALLDRDRQLATEGRQIADGRMGSRLLREFVRATLNLVEHRDLPIETRVNKLLTAMGAEPADARQIQLRGHTLGPASEEEEAAERRYQEHARRWEEAEAARGVEEELPPADVELVP